jgi:hypothetical protein
MRVLGRRTKNEMLAAAGVSRVCIGVFGDAARCQFESRRLGDLDELESALRAHNFIALLTFIGVPPQTWLAVQLDHEAAQSFNELVSRLTTAAATQGSFWLSQPAPLAMASGSRKIEAGRVG